MMFQAIIGVSSDVSLMFQCFILCDSANSKWNSKLHDMEDKRA